MLPKVFNHANLPGWFLNRRNSDIMNDFFGFGDSFNMPAVNISEHDDNYRIELAAPGMNKKDFKVNVENDLLTISFERKAENEEKKENYLRREFGYQSFERSFSLGENVDVDKIKAEHKNGILSIEVPKKEEAKAKPPKQISIA
jgi:HSP20 family protein